MLFQENNTYCDRYRNRNLNFEYAFKIFNFSEYEQITFHTRKCIIEMRIIIVA